MIERYQHGFTRLVGPLFPWLTERHYSCPKKGSFSAQIPDVHLTGWDAFSADMKARAIFCAHMCVVWSNLDSSAGTCSAVT